MKKNFLTVAVILSLLTVTLAFALATYAIWSKEEEGTVVIDIPGEDYNPSLKHIIFYGLDSLDLSTAKFTADSAKTAAYAAVGYDGMVAEVVIPETYLDLPVIMVCGHKDYSDRSFRLNEDITSIEIPVSVVRIEDGTFSNMKNLRTVTILGGSEDAALVMGNYVFSSCKNLQSFIRPDFRIIEGDPSLYFYDTGIIV